MYSNILSLLLSTGNGIAMITLYSSHDEHIYALLFIISMPNMFGNIV